MINKARDRFLKSTHRKQLFKYIQSTNVAVDNIIIDLMTDFATEQLSEYKDKIRKKIMELEKKQDDFVQRNIYPNAEYINQIELLEEILKL